MKPQAAFRVFRIHRSARRVYNERGGTTPLPELARILIKASAMSVLAVLVANGAAGEGMPAAEQNALVKKYCAVCHTDAAKNGGLSLEHYDAARADPPLAAMLLSKLRNGAMGAAGSGSPDDATREA